MLSRALKSCHCSLLVLALATSSLAQAPTPPAPPTPAELGHALPDKPPAWVAGYRLRWPLRLLGDPVVQKTQQTVIAHLPSGGWLRPDGTDVAVQDAKGQMLPVTVLSHDPLGETVIQFPRSGNERWYWAYGVSAATAPKVAKPAAEGMTMEIRAWAGDDLQSWAKVLDGLKKSDNVIGNAVVSDVVHNCNPMRPDDPRKFAASYRGSLNIAKDGVYRFFVNCDDAGFLFIDGFKVYERTGANTRAVGSIPLRSVGADIELKAGVHSFEVHHVMGNNPSAIGYCALLWLTPEAPKAWAFVPRAAFVPSLYAEVAALEEASGAPAADFVFGVDDTISYGGSTLYLTRFEANGKIKDPAQLVWDFGDGTTGTGRSPLHVYFKNGSYTVTLQSVAGLPVHRRTVHVWQIPMPTSPLAFGKAIKALSAMDWKKLDFQRQNQLFEFLSLLEQPDRAPLLEGVARQMLTLKDLDPQLRATLYSGLFEALAIQDRGLEAVKLSEPALKEFAKIPSLRIAVQLATGNIYGKYLKEPAEASRIYNTIMEENRRLEHPSVRLAAIRLGDLYADAGDVPKANETYRLALTLGGDKFKSTAQTEAVTRGALLRIAEQKLRNGDIRQTRQLLERIELDYPEQKLEGLYRFLRAETDRFGGRYEEAIRNYEFLLKLTQWAGFRDRALHGIADCNLRMGNSAKAVEWLDVLEKSFPKYYEKQKLADYKKTAEERLAREKASQQTGGVVRFAGFMQTYEANEKHLPADIPGYNVVPGEGIEGSQVCAIDSIPTPPPVATSQSYPVQNIDSSGTYWLEFWYRGNELSTIIPYLFTPQIQAFFYDAKNQVHPDGGTVGPMNLDRPYGRWRKFAVQIRAPLATDGRLMMYIHYALGAFEVDGLSLQPISDRQNDLFRNFLEGAEKP